MSFGDMLNKQQPIQEIATYLNSLSHQNRLAECRSLSSKQLKQLYDVAATAEPLDLSHFVPAETAKQQEMIHFGLNSMPLPKVFTVFQKRFCIPPNRQDCLFGYNHGATTKAFGPGYFVAKNTAGNPDWEKRGGVVIDYFEIPDEATADGWPKVVPNSRGLQIFVYHKMRDFMRKVSDHVSIGIPYKGNKAMGVRFILCRSDD